MTTGGAGAPCGPARPSRSPEPASQIGPGRETASRCGGAMLSTTRSEQDQLRRTDGYAPIGSYAPIGDGRSVALVALDGAIDWLCAPDLDSPSVFAALLDPVRGGHALLRPAGPYSAERAYLDGTNVLSTTFRCAQGSIRVVDAMELAPQGAGDARTVIRAVECLSGSVELDWDVVPRPGYGETGPAGARQVRVQAFGLDRSARLTAGERALVAVAIGESLPPARSRDDLEAALDATTRTWRRWRDGLRCEGPWRDAVLRSALVLELLTNRRTGAIAAAATTSLPEDPGGSRNW